MPARHVVSVALLLAGCAADHGVESGTARPSEDLSEGIVVSSASWRLDWIMDGVEPGERGWSTTTDLGYRAGIEAGWVLAYSVTLSPCIESTASRSERLWSVIGLGTAYADHPDFEANIAAETGIVERMLGTDFKPVYAGGDGTATTSGADNFDQWYRDVDGVNMTFTEPIPLTETSPGVFVFDDSDFFPLDGRGWPDEEIDGHNFHFTTEIHAGFTYRGGEIFTFRGDDDVWLFINSRLALDLGGVHGPQEGTVDFDAMADELGITPGNTYRFDIFHAERHTTQSNFRLETSLECFQTLI